MVDIREYLDQNGRSPYGQWFDKLNAQAAAKVATAIMRVAHGNLSNVKGIGGSLFEYRLDYGQDLLRQGWRHADHTAGGWYQKTSAARY